MTFFTTKEKQMLKAFYQTSIDNCGDCSEFENLSYSNAQDLAEDLGWGLQSIGGVMSSLEAKCAINDCGESSRGARLNDFVINAWPATSSRPNPKHQHKNPQMN